MHMNIRTILFAGSLCLLTLSPLQATTPAIEGITTIETKVADKKTDQLKPVQATKAETNEVTSEKAVPSDMNSNVTMSVGTIIVILLLIIILL